MGKIMLAPDGYYSNGTSRPFRKVEILEIRPAIKRSDSTVWFKYCDTGEQGWTIKRLLKEVPDEQEKP